MPNRFCETSLCLGTRHLENIYKSLHGHTQEQGKNIAVAACRTLKFDDSYPMLNTLDSVNSEQLEILTEAVAIAVLESHGE